MLTTSGGYSKLRAVTGGKYLDSVDRTADGSVVGQWADSPSFNQQWSLVAVDSFYKLVNRANGKALDSGGQTGDGAVMQFWYDNVSFNQQWAFEFVSSSTSLSAVNATSDASFRAQQIEVALAKPTLGTARVSIADRTGLVWAEETFQGDRHSVSTADMPAGRYSLKVIDDHGVVEERTILIKP